MANGSWLPAGGATVIATVCCGATCTVCGGAWMDWLPVMGTTVTVAEAASVTADSSRPTVTLPLAGFPAMIPCSVTGAAAALKDPMPLPGTAMPATTGTFEVSTSVAAEVPSEVSASDVAAPDGASCVVEPNGAKRPCAVSAVTATCASTGPGTAMNSRAALLAVVRPGITSFLAGAPAC